MPEAFSTSEVSHAVRHHRDEQARPERLVGLVEVLEACLLAFVAIATAWGGYQAARWDGRQSKLYAQSSKNRDRVRVTLVVVSGALLVVAITFLALYPRA
jgi:hypothetical protein